MSAKQHFTTEQTRKIGDKLGIDWSRSNVEQFRMGLMLNWNMSCMTRQQM